MRRLALFVIALGCITTAGCGDSSPPRSTPPPFTGPTTPTPPQQTFTLAGLAKEAWIDTGLPGVTVSIVTGPARGSTVTDAQGRYALPNLVPGVYSVSFSKPAPYGSSTYPAVNVVGDSTLNATLSLTGGFPVTAANLQGYWVAQGPYPNEPCWILIFQNGSKLDGWYKDRRDYSTTMSGSRTGDSVVLNVASAGLTIEGRVEDERCIRAVIKNEALGGNFPVALSRGGSCSR
jgi:hypothetical protein